MAMDDPEGEEAIDRLLEPWGNVAFNFLMNLGLTCQQMGRWPWAIVLFEKEYQLAGHAVSLRKCREDFGFSSYSSEMDYTLSEAGVPRLSFFIVFNRDAFKAAAGESPLFLKAWDLLEGKSESLHWIGIADPPPQEWVVEASARDAQLFVEMTSG